MSTTSWPPSEKFWTDTLPDRTRGMTTPYLFKGIVPPQAADAEAVLSAFAAIRGAHQADTPITASARVYVGEDLRPDLLAEVLEAQPWAEGEFVPWMQNLIGEQRFSLVLNALESTSPALAAGLGQFLKALMEGWGVPVGGAELVAFVGNYSGTAFGVHEGYENAFLTHYGPGVKHFYCWPPELYKKLRGSAEPLYGDYDWLLGHGEHFALEPGDALFLPERVFHVGRQDEFSVSVAVPLYTFPDTAIAREFVLPDLLGPLVASDPDTETGHPSPMIPLNDGGAQLARRLADRTTDVLAQAAERAAPAAREHVHQRWHTILSNGGWQLVENDLGRTEAASAFDPQQVAAGAQAQVIAPYRLMTTGGQAFLRGCEIAGDQRVLTDDLVAALNAGSMPLPDDPRVLDAIRALGATGGLALTPAPTADAQTNPSKQMETAAP